MIETYFFSAARATETVHRGELQYSQSTDGSCPPVTITVRYSKGNGGAGRELMTRVDMPKDE
jgi:hypothetical protein